MIDKTLVRADIFAYALRNVLGHNMSEYLLNTVANMLSLYYASNPSLGVQFSTPNLYADSCASRLKGKLGKRVILNDDLEEALSLFATAIADTTADEEELPSMMKLANQEVVSEIIASVILGEEGLAPEERSNLTQMLKMGSENKDVLKLFQAKPTLVRGLIKRKKMTAGELSNDVIELTKNIAKTQSISNNFAQLAGLLVASGVAFASHLVAVSSIESLAPAVIVPLSVATLKLAPQIGEMLGGYLSKYETGYQKTLNKIDQIVEKFMPSQGLKDLPSREIPRSSEVGVVRLDVSDIAKELDKHIDKVATEKELQQVRDHLKEKQLNRSQPRGLER